MSGDKSSDLEKGPDDPSDGSEVPGSPTSNTKTSATLVEDTGLKSRLQGYLKSIRSSWDRVQIKSPTQITDTKIRKLEDYPRGFPKLACFLDSDDAFMVYRRFGGVFSRLLLNKQDEISEMEKALHTLDTIDQRSGDGKYLMSRSSDIRRGQPDGWSGQRPELLGRLEKACLEYAELLLKAQEMKGLSQPSKRDYQSVLNFMENNGGQVFEEESEFIYHKDDLVTLRPGREYAWLDGTIERILQTFRCKILAIIFAPKETREKTFIPEIHYYDRSRISTCVTWIVTAMILILLMVPIWVLYHLSITGTIATSPKTISVIIVPTLVFAAVISAFTSAKRHELLAASAGYCAVLVVFLGNINNNVGQSHGVPSLQNITLSSSDGLNWVIA